MRGSVGCCPHHGSLRVILPFGCIWPPWSMRILRFLIPCTVSVIIISTYLEEQRENSTKKIIKSVVPTCTMLENQFWLEVRFRRHSEAYSAPQDPVAGSRTAEDRRSRKNGRERKEWQELGSNSFLRHKILISRCRTAKFSPLVLEMVQGIDIDLLQRCSSRPQLSLASNGVSFFINNYVFI